MDSLVFHMYPYKTDHLQSPAPWVLVAMPFKASSILKETVYNFWEKNCSPISERSRQKGLQYACESYIHNIICQRSIVDKENINIEEKKLSGSNTSILTSHVKQKHIAEHQRSCTGKKLILMFYMGGT